MKKGRIIVIEGPDASGKKTQLELLKQSFEEMNVPFVTFDFPQYKETAGGILLDKILWRNRVKEKTKREKELFPNPNIISPYLLALPYAVDRAFIVQKMREALENGKFVLLNRYRTSSFGHQASKLKTIREKVEFIGWLEKLEIENLGLPKEDVVFLMDISSENQKKLSRKRGRKEDMAEADREHQKKSLETYRWLAKQLECWVSVQCQTPSGKMRAPKTINQEIINTLKKRRII
jgi:dTMP kinase